MKGILGRKVGMTQVFTKDGKLVPVTVIEVEPNVVTQVKTVATDGYDAVQLGVFDRKEKNANKPSIGHTKKANTSPKRFLKEIRGVNVNDYTLGSIVGADIFEVGEVVDVTGTSKGKGFQGVIKRHNQSRGPETHGSRFHRRPGSMGSMKLMRVRKGKKLPGHMGNETVTIQNLKVIDINVNENYILVSGNVPGPKNSLVLVKENIKGNKKEEIELLVYEETIVDEVVENEETTKDEVEEVVEEVEEETPEQVEEVVEQIEEATEEQTEEATEEVQEEKVDEGGNE